MFAKLRQTTPFIRVLKSRVLSKKKFLQTLKFIGCRNRNTQLKFPQFRVPFKSHCKWIEFHAVGIFPPGQHQSHQAEALHKRGANVGFCSSASVTNGNKWQRMTEDVSDGENYMEILSDTVMLSTSRDESGNIKVRRLAHSLWSCNASCVLTVEKKRQVFTVKMFGNESLISFRGESEQFLESRGRSDA